MYCGIITVPPFENEEMQLVKPKHKPLKSDSLFYEVQDVLNGNKRKVVSKVISDDRLPLMGFLECTLKAGCLQAVLQKAGIIITIITIVLIRSVKADLRQMTSTITSKII
jgi:hypothetical protein